MTSQQIHDVVAALLAEKHADVQAKRWQLRGQLTGVLAKDKLKWADSEKV